MTSILIYLKHNFPWLWRPVEWVNGGLFRLRYPEIRQVAARILESQDNPDLDYSLVTMDDVGALVEFFGRQPEECYACFNPHGFDARSLSRVIRNDAFLTMKITGRTDGRIVGYFFLRCFFIGRAFHGLIVDAWSRGHDYGTSMWAISQQICRECGLKMYATVSTLNLPSIGSARRATAVRIVEMLPDDYLLIECRPKES